MKSVTQIIFNGNAQEAVDYYTDAFNCKAGIMKYKDLPNKEGFEMSEEDNNRLAWAKLEKDDFTLLISDVATFGKHVIGNDYCVVVYFHDEYDAKKVFGKLSDNARVEMEQETFFAKYYAKLTDKFGVQWKLIVSKMQY